MKKFKKIDKYKDVVCSRLHNHQHYEFHLSKKQETKLRIRIEGKKLFRVDGINLDKAITIWKLLAKGVTIAQIAKEIKIHRKHVGIFIKKYRKFSQTVYSLCANYKNSKPKPYNIYTLDLKKWVYDLNWDKIQANNKKRQKAFSKSKDFYEYYVEANKNYLLNKNKKDFKITAYKKSADEIIQSFKNKYPEKSTPKKSAFYAAMNNKYLNFPVNILPLKSLGKSKWTPSVKPTKIIKKDFGIDINNRPEYINLRLGKYDWELDTVHGKKGDKWILLSVMNRRSRRHYYLKVQRNAQSIADGLRFLIEKYHLVIQSVTIDNGVENYKLDQLKIKIYRCHPYASWQKGSIESAHRKIRKFLPKGKTFDNLTNQDIEDITDRINEMPIRNSQFPFYMNPSDFENSTYF